MPKRSSRIGVKAPPKARLAPLIKVLLVLCALVFAAIAAMFVIIFWDRGKNEQASAPAAEETGPVDARLFGRWIERRYGIVIAFFEDGAADSFHPFAGTTRQARYSTPDGRLMLSGYGVDASFIYEVEGDELTLTAGEGGFAFEELSVQEGETIVFQELVAFFEEDSGVPIPSAARAELSGLILGGASMPEIIEFVEAIEPEYAR